MKKCPSRCSVATSMTSRCSRMHTFVLSFRCITRLAHFCDWFSVMKSDYEYGIHLQVSAKQISIWLQRGGIDACTAHTESTPISRFSDAHTSHTFCLTKIIQLLSLQKLTPPKEFRNHMIHCQLNKTHCHFAAAW